MSAEGVFNGTVDVVTGMSPEDHKQTVLTAECQAVIDTLAELTPPLSGLPAAPSRTELRRLHPQVLTIPPRTQRGAPIRDMRVLSAAGARGNLDHMPVPRPAFVHSYLCEAGPMTAAKVRAQPAGVAEYLEIPRPPRLLLTPGWSLGESVACRWRPMPSPPGWVN
jgi:hypothetical protein